MRHLLKHGTLLTAGTAFAGLLNYFFMVFAARGLGPQDFGSLGLLLTFLFVWSAAVMTIRTLIAQNVCENEVKCPQRTIASVIRSGLASVSMYSIAVTFLYAAAAPLIDRAFGVGSLSAILLIALVCILRAESAIFRGALDGLQRFNVVAATAVAEAAVRFSIALILLATAFTLVRVTGAFVVSAIALVAIPTFFLPVDWRTFLDGRPRMRAMKLTTRAWTTGLSFALLATLTQVDMLAVKYFLSADVAGHYAAAINLIKAPLLLIGGAFATVMFPSIVRAHARARHGLRELATTTGAVTAAVLAVVAICHIWADPIVSLLLGADYAPLAGWLGAFALASVPAPLLYLVARYHMVAHGRLLMGVLASGCVLFLGFLALFHQTITHMLLAMIIGTGFPLAVLAVHLGIIAVRATRQHHDRV